MKTSCSVFNPKKLLWYNEQYLRDLPSADILKQLRKLDTVNTYAEASDSFMEKAISMLTDRASIVTDFLNEGKYFVEAPTQIDEKRFRLLYKPDFHHVKINGRDDCSSYRQNCREYEGKIIVHAYRIIFSTTDFKKNLCFCTL